MGASHQEVRHLLLDPDLALNGKPQPATVFPSPSCSKVRIVREPAQPAPDPAIEPRRTYVRVKLALDILAAGLLSIVALPLVAAAAFIVKITSRGPAFYSQIRLGRNGRPFKIYKVRTMVHDCESFSGPRWSTPGDPRIIPVGLLLRRTHVDELPQLLNVLRGQMSLIGPRPERPEFLAVLEQAVPNYRNRLLVRPGVTGLRRSTCPQTPICSACAESWHTTSPTSSE